MNKGKKKERKNEDGIKDRNAGVVKRFECKKKEKEKGKTKNERN